MLLAVEAGSGGNAGLIQFQGALEVAELATVSSEVAYQRGSLRRSYSPSTRWCQAGFLLV